MVCEWLLLLPFKGTTHPPSSLLTPSPLRSIPIEFCVCLCVSRCSKKRWRARQRERETVLRVCHTRSLPLSPLASLYHHTKGQQPFRTHVRPFAHDGELFHPIGKEGYRRGVFSLCLLPLLDHHHTAPHVAWFPLFKQKGFQSHRENAPQQDSNKGGSPF